MTIQVVCECGFSKEVPDKWLGMRVKCKCGRSFVISEDGGILEPPVAAPPVSRSRSGRNASEKTTPPADRPTRATTTVRRRTHPERTPHSRKRVPTQLVLGGGALVAVICLGAVAFLMRDTLLDRSTDTTQTEPGQLAQSKDTTPQKPRVKQTRTDSQSTPSTPAKVDQQPKNSNEPVELIADDGLFLTGLFGEGVEKLGCTEQQLSKFEEFAKQLKTKDEELVGGKLPLEQWYVDTGNIGDELLTLLTDAQRDQLKEMIQQQQITRVRLELHAAKLRPELTNPIVTWKMEPDGAAVPAIKDFALSGTTSGNCIRTKSISGAFAFASGATPNGKFEFWDLATSNRLGNCELPPADVNDTTIIARGGHRVVRFGKRTEGGYRVQVWSVGGTDTSDKTMNLPVTKQDDGAPVTYQLVDCVGQRVVCACRHGFWIWNIESGDTQQITFPDWVPQAMPVSTVSPGGKYVAAVHPHSLAAESKQYNFAEIGVYDIETGELLGNQVVATDYRPFHVSAIQYSYNGQDLALLWNVEPPEPKRMVVHLNASNGELRGVAEDIPLADQGYANQNGLRERDLMWLPDNTGWIVNLQSFVDMEAGSVIDIDLPRSTDSAEGKEPAVKRILDAIPAGNRRILFIVAEPSKDNPSILEVRGEFIDLPDTSPFM